jgi:tetratricopeptide (TPR) repeat protein
MRDAIIGDIGVRWRRAHIYEQQNDYENAIIEYTGIIAEAGDDHLFRCRTLIERAKLYEDQGQYDKALADRSAIIEISEAHARYNIKAAYEERIALYRKMGDLDNAALEYRKMIELDDSGGLDDSPRI